MAHANSSSLNETRTEHRDTPGEFTFTANGQIQLRSTADGVRSMWLRGYALVGAPMGVAAPLYNQLLVQFPGSELNHLNRFTDSPVQGYPLLVEGANTYHQYDKPRLMATCSNGQLKNFSVALVTPQGATADPLGNPLFASVTLDIVLSTRPVQHDPVLATELRTWALQEGAIRY